MIKKFIFIFSTAVFLTILFQWGAVKSVSASAVDRLSVFAIPTAALDQSPTREFSQGGQLYARQYPMIVQQKSFNAWQPIPLVIRKILINDQVSLNLGGPGQVALTVPITLSGYLIDLNTGAGIANKSITFSIGGVDVGQTHTDALGSFSAKINNNLPAGTYLITAYFKGAHLLDPASAAVSFEVLPATITIQTVPAIQGITFKMYGQQFTSDSNGLARIKINQAGQYRLDVLLDQYRNPAQQIEFGRWLDETYVPYRVVTVPSDNVIQIGLNIYHRVNFKFVDLDGYPVDPSRISLINIRGIQGDFFALKPTDAPWLPASRTARRLSGLQVTDLLYSINSVTIDGSNVVNSAQQRFYAKTDDTWTITLLLYSLNISVRDGLFASPVGKSIDLIFPDGQTKNYTLDPSGNLQVHTLARGIYHISVIGVKGLATTTPVALSRNQVVKLNIVTNTDIKVAGGFAIVFATGLVLYGRSRLLVILLRRKKAASSGLSWSQKHET
jgi:hypothetical protein